MEFGIDPISHVDTVLSDSAPNLKQILLSFGGDFVRRFHSGRNVMVIATFQPY